jgi:hypothetical protein
MCGVIRDKYTVWRYPPLQRADIVGGIGQAHGDGLFALADEVLRVLHQRRVCGGGGHFIAVIVVGVVVIFVATVVEGFVIMVVFVVKGRALLKWQHRQGAQSAPPGRRRRAVQAGVASCSSAGGWFFPRLDDWPSGPEDVFRGFLGSVMSCWSVLPMSFTKMHPFRYSFMMASKLAILYSSCFFSFSRAAPLSGPWQLSHIHAQHGRDHLTLSSQSTNSLMETFMRDLQQESDEHQRDQQLAEIALR